MGGYFGIVSKSDCVHNLYYGTDYHSHLGTHRGGLCVKNGENFLRSIHNIENTQFRSKFEDDIKKMSGNMGIGCISDTDDQPLIIRSHLGTFAIVTVGRINNTKQLLDKSFNKFGTHFSEMDSGIINPTELIASLINQESSFEDGIQHVQDSISGSCSLLLLTSEGIFAARDRFGRTPMIIGENNDSYCVSMETCVFPNLEYNFKYELGAGETVFLSAEGMDTRIPARDILRICTFLWIYYGYPASSYEGRNVEIVRNRSGAALARNDNVKVDLVAGIPDSGIAHALGYSNQAGIPYRRPFVKYTPTWPRSFMPQNQNIRNLVARMKLIPIPELIQGKRLLFCEDSIVRGTQLRETIQRLYEYGATEVHMRPACPPLIFSCKYLNFSRSRSELDLAAQQAINELENQTDNIVLEKYTNSESGLYQDMVNKICERLTLTSLKYQTMNDMIEAVGLAKEKLCTYCWDGQG
jgi:amidophosphoribosyltransferase